jgi:cbb3-type cytochrome oxidase subunit 3
MSLALIFAAGLALLFVALGGGWFWALRSRRRPDVPVSEAEARAHALPLTTSVLSVGPRPPDREPVGLDS